MPPRAERKGKEGAARKAPLLISKCGLCLDPDCREHKTGPDLRALKDALEVVSHTFFQWAFDDTTATECRDLKLASQDCAQAARRIGAVLTSFNLGKRLEESLATLGKK